MILIICEKPSQAGDYAKALNARRRDGYFESEKYLITYASGHLFEMYSIEEYTGVEKGLWTLDQLPFIPEEFKWKAMSHTKDRIATIKTLTKRATMIIDAMDYDREAELIFYELDHELEFQVPIKRILLTSYTEKDVLNGLNNLQDRMINLEKAAIVRAVIDWILGINYTRAFTLRTGNHQTLSLGRVMLPTLNLLYMREKEIKNFIPKAFYALEGIFSTGESSYVGKYIEDDVIKKTDSKVEIENIVSAIKSDAFTIESKETVMTKEHPSKLYSLSSLQKEITNKYKEFTSDKVLEIAQTLYERKFTTYPRTDSMHLDDSQLEEAKDSLEAILILSEFNRVKDHVKLHQDKRTFNSKKVSGHPALMPTSKVPNMDDLTDKEKIIYLAITRRFLMHFMPTAEYEETTLITAAGDHKFKSKDKCLTTYGWKELLEEQEAPKEKTLINASEGMTVNADLIIQTGKSSAPKKYKEGDLIHAMKTCGDKVDDEEVLQCFTMGAPSTRAEIIKKLIKYEYVKKTGLQMEVTSLGRKVIEAFPIKEILDVTFTGRIEKVLKLIELGEVDDQEFMARMNDFFKKTMAILKSADIPIIEKEYEPIGKCPDCGGKVLDMPKVYKCDNPECKVIIYKNDKALQPYKKKMTKTVAKQLLKKKEASMKGLTDPDDNSKFDTIIRYEKNSMGNYCLRINKGVGGL